MAEKTSGPEASLSYALPPVTGGTPSPGELAAQHKASLVRIVRMAFVVMMVTVTILYILNTQGASGGGDALFGIGLGIGWHIPLTAGVVLCLLVLAIDLLTPRKKIATISGVFFGLLVGLMAAYAMSFVLDLLVQAYDIRAKEMVAAIKVLIGISLCYLGMSSVLQTQDDFRLVIPYVEFAKQLRGAKPLLLDTSALIDARVVDLASTGILAVPLVVPRFVIEELQALADSGDKMKRARGRRGLEVIARLQRNPQLDVTVDETPIPGKAVDQMLVELARTMSATIVTADSGLNRIAGIQQVGVLNLNEVANALKPALIPGTRVVLELVKPGEQPGQAVGFLEDGTMVVVDGGEDRIGSEAEIEVSSALTTSAGRLIFARLTHKHAAAPVVTVANAPAPALPQAEAQHAEHIQNAQNADDEPHEPAPPSPEVGQDAGHQSPPAPSDRPGQIVRPPAGPTPPKPGPLGPRTGRSNPMRNPRR